MKVFISSQAVDRAPAVDLIAALRSAGVEVAHSPSNPLDHGDPRWHDWYASGLAAAVTGCRAFVIVVDAVWDSSSWMGEEASFALERAASDAPPRAFYWNPTRVVVRAAGMTRYLREELPPDFGSAVARVVEASR